MKNLNTSFIILLCCISINSCKDVPVSDVPVFVPGISGKITDSTGNAIDNVSIFILFQESYIPISLIKTQNLLSPLKPDSFGFSLEQNFPNPVNHSTFIRFSLPQECYTALQIQKKGSERISFTMHDTLPPGYYQIYINNIVDSLNLVNGIYRYNLHAIGKNGIEYHQEIEMFVVSSEGYPNALSGSDGKYFIPFVDAYIGDTVTYKSSESPSYTYTRVINNSIRILCQKEGYNSTYVDIQMFPSLLLFHDIVLFKKKNP